MDGGVVWPQDTKHGLQAREAPPAPVCDGGARAEALAVLEQVVGQGGGFADEHQPRGSCCTWTLHFELGGVWTACFHQAFEQRPGCGHQDEDARSYHPFQHLNGFCWREGEGEQKAEEATNLTAPGP